VYQDNPPSCWDNCRGYRSVNVVMRNRAAQPADAVGHAHHNSGFTIWSPRVGGATIRIEAHARIAGADAFTIGRTRVRTALNPERDQISCIGDTSQKVKPAGPGASISSCRTALGQSVGCGGPPPEESLWEYPHTKDVSMPTVQVRKFRDIGPVIKAVRESCAIRQEDLAKQLAFSRDYLIDLEKGSGGLGEFRWWLQHRSGLTDDPRTAILGLSAA